VSVDKAMLIKHLSEAKFQIGLDKVSWEIASLTDFPDWPYVIIRIRAKRKVDCPDMYSFRFNLTNYPSIAPTCMIWDEAKEEILEDSNWPKGARYVSSVFNPGWRKDALYCPLDRVALEGHETWKENLPEYYWRAGFTIVNYLQFIYDLLNSDDYANG
jgi:hypothetical protein